MTVTSSPILSSILFSTTNFHDDVNDAQLTVARAANNIIRTTNTATILPSSLNIGYEDCQLLMMVNNNHQEVESFGQVLRPLVDSDETTLDSIAGHGYHYDSGYDRATMPRPCLCSDQLLEHDFAYYYCYDDNEDGGAGDEDQERGDEEKLGREEGVERLEEIVEVLVQDTAVSDGSAELIAASMETKADTTARTTNNNNNPLVALMSKAGNSAARESSSHSSLSSSILLQQAIPVCGGRKRAWSITNKMMSMGLFTQEDALMHDDAKDEYRCIIDQAHSSSSSSIAVDNDHHHISSSDSKTDDDKSSLYDQGFFMSSSSFFQGQYQRYGNVGHHLISSSSSSADLLINPRPPSLSNSTFLQPGINMPFLLPCHASPRDAIPRITPATMVDLLDGKYINDNMTVHVIDCRYEYEYTGGHIPEAVNISTTPAMLKYLTSLSQQHCQDEGDQDSKCNPFKATIPGHHSPHVLIFHCEFSQERGPRMALFVRSSDRAANPYPHLSFPHLYIMEGGYRAFWQQAPSRCDPPFHYRPMRASCFKPALKQARRGTRMDTRTRRWEKQAKVVLSASQPVPGVGALMTSSSSPDLLSKASGVSKIDAYLGTIVSGASKRANNPTISNLFDQACIMASPSLAVEQSRAQKSLLMTQRHSSGEGEYGTPHLYKKARLDHTSNVTAGQRSPSFRQAAGMCFATAGTSSSLHPSEMDIRGNNLFFARASINILDTETGPTQCYSQPQQQQHLPSSHMFDLTSNAFLSSSSEAF